MPGCGDDHKKHYRRRRLRSGILSRFSFEWHDLAPLLHLSRGTFSDIVVGPSPSGDLGLWRVRFDLDAQGNELVELRCHLSVAEEAVDGDLGLSLHTPASPARRPAPPHA